MRTNNLTRFPLCKRGIEGDFGIREMFKSPLAPLLQREECFRITQITSDGLSGLMENSK